MKNTKKILGLALLGVCFSVFVSCVSVPVETPTTIEVVDFEKSEFATTNVEFIGFNSTKLEGDSKLFWNELENHSCISEFGKKMEEKNYAKNGFGRYYGNYAITDLINYKAKSRYIAFIDINKNFVTWDSSDKRIANGVFGGIDLGFGLMFMLLSSSLNQNADNYVNSEGRKGLATFCGIMSGAGFIGALCGFIGANQKPSTKAAFECDYKIVIFDTKEQSIVKTYSNKYFASEEKLVGKVYDKNDETNLYQYYSIPLCNSLINDFKKTCAEFNNK